MSKNWLKSDNSEMISGKEWKVTILWHRFSSTPCLSMVYSINSNPERKKLANPGTEEKTRLQSWWEMTNWNSEAEGFAGTVIDHGPKSVVTGQILDELQGNRGRRRLSWNPSRCKTRGGNSCPENKQIVPWLPCGNNTLGKERQQRKKATSF